MQRILRIHDQGLTVITRDRRGVRRMHELPATEHGRRCLRRWLARDRRRPVRVLVDLADETLHEARVARVGVRDRGALLRRTAARHFAPEDHIVVHRLARDRDGERLRIAGVPAAGPLDTWLAVIGDVGVAVAAIHSAALAGESLSRLSGMHDSPALLSVIRRDSATVRQCFHREGRVVFTRCARAPRGDRDALSREVVRALEFIHGRLPGREGTGVVVVLDEPGMEATDLRAAMPANVELRSLALRAPAREANVDALAVALPSTHRAARLARGRGDYPLPGVHRRRESCRRGARMLNGLTVATLVAAAALALGSGHGERILLAERERSAAQRMALMAQEPLWLRDSGGEVHAPAPVVSRLAFVARHLPAHKGEPGAAMARVGAHLPADGAVVEAFEWAVGGQRDEEIRLAGTWPPNRAEAGRFEAFVRALEDTGRWDEVTIERRPGAIGDGMRAGDVGTAAPSAAEDRFAVRLRRENRS